MNKAQIHRGSKNRTRLCRTQSHAERSGWPRSTFYEQRSRRPSPTQQRRADLDGKVKACFAASGGTLRLSQSTRSAAPRRPWRSRKRPSRGVDGPPGVAGTRAQTQAVSDPR